MNKQTENLLLIAGGAALLYYILKNQGGVNADMGGCSFGVRLCNPNYQTTPGLTPFVQQTCPNWGA